MPIMSSSERRVLVLRGERGRPVTARPASTRCPAHAPPLQLDLGAQVPAIRVFHHNAQLLAPAVAERLVKPDDVVVIQVSQQLALALRRLDFLPAQRAQRHLVPGSGEVRAGSAGNCGNDRLASRSLSIRGHAPASRRASPRICGAARPKQSLDVKIGPDSGAHSELVSLGTRRAGAFTAPRTEAAFPKLVLADIRVHCGAWAGRRGTGTVSTGRRWEVRHRHRCLDVSSSTDPRASCCRPAREVDSEGRGLGRALPSGSRRQRTLSLPTAARGPGVHAQASVDACAGKCSLRRACTRIALLQWGCVRGAIPSCHVAKVPFPMLSIHALRQAEARAARDEEEVVHEERRRPTPARDQRLLQALGRTQYARCSPQPLPVH